MRSRQIIRYALLSGSVWLSGCSIEAMRITLEATDAASTVFKEARDEVRIKRDADASRRLGELCGRNHLTTAEVQPLKRIVAEAKGDGRVTLDEADHILVEMERIVALHRP